MSRLKQINFERATVVSMDPSLGIIDTGDILVDDGKIVAVGQNLGSWAVLETTAAT